MNSTEVVILLLTAGASCATLFKALIYLNHPGSTFRGLPLRMVLFYVSILSFTFSLGIIFKAR